MPILVKNLPDDLAGDVLSTRLLVVHDAGRGGQHNVAELTRWQQLDDPFLKVADADIVPRGDHSGLVDPARQFRTLTVVSSLPSIELDDNLAGSVVVDLLKLANVA